jgi:hypothetical protein
MNPLRRQEWWFDLALFENQSDGRVLEKFLRDNNFETRTYDDKLLRYFLFLRPPRATYRVQVRKGDVDRAVQLLEKNSTAILDRALHCPSCGSLRVNYPQMTRKFFLPTALVHLGIIFRVIEHECYCEHCHYIWNLPAEVPHRMRAAKHFPF